MIKRKIVVSLCLLKTESVMKKGEKQADKWVFFCFTFFVVVQVDESSSILLLRVITYSQREKKINIRHI
jgi:hypothetical protein